MVDDEDKKIDGKLHKLGAELTVGHPLGEYTRGSLTLGIENNRYSGELADFVNPYSKLTLSGGVLTNTTDNPFSPTEGFKNRVYLETGMALAGGSHYSKISLEHSRYYQIFRDDIIFAVRGKGGRVLSGDLRNEEMFHIGGPENLRGYSNEQKGLTGIKCSWLIRRFVFQSMISFPALLLQTGVRLGIKVKPWI